MKNSVAHFEIYADDPDALTKFYTDLFDWQTQKMPNMDYTYVKTVDTNAQNMPTQPGGINGGLIRRPTGYKTKAWVNYVTVESLETSLKRAQELGAKVMKPRAPIPGIGWFAMLIDPQGNDFAIWQSDPGAK